MIASLIASVEMGALTGSDMRSNEEVVILEASARLNSQRSLPCDEPPV